MIMMVNHQLTPMTNRIMVLSSYFLIICPLSLSVGFPSVIIIRTLVASGEKPAFWLSKMFSLKQMYKYNTTCSDFMDQIKRSNLDTILSFKAHGTDCQLQSVRSEGKRRFWTNTICSLTTQMLELYMCWWEISFAFLFQEIQKLSPFDNRWSQKPFQVLKRTELQQTRDKWDGSIQLILHE